MKKVIAVNGSPRKKWNTATLLGKAVEGAKDAGAEVGEIIHLYDLDYRGCISCFACKRKEGGALGHCTMKDGLSPVLEKIKTADVLLLGSPIYVADVTGMMRSFMERLIFSNITYDKGEPSTFGRVVNTGFIYTMNFSEASQKKMRYDYLYTGHAAHLRHVLKGKYEYMASFDTLQFDDYSKYYASVFDPAHKAEMREKQFPEDCRSAYEMGRRLASE